MFSVSRRKRGARVASPSKLASKPTHFQCRLTLEKLEDRTLLSISLSATKWTPIGPASLANGGIPGGGRVSGRVAAIASDPTDASIIYLAAAGGGVWKTTNGGNSWKPLTDSQTTLAMGALAIAPSNHLVLYAGTGESNNSFDSFYGRGVLKSIDGGGTWTLMGNSVFNLQAISKIVVDPTNSNVVYVADSGDAENGADTGNIGVWKTTDGGAIWVNTTAANPGYDHNEGAFSDLVIDPSNPQTLYTAIGTDGGEAANGIYKTTNGGTSWALAGNSPQGVTLGRISLAIAPSAPQTLFAAISGTGQTGSSTYGTLFEMLKSTDGGGTWSVLANTPNYLWFQGWYDTSLKVAPTNANVIFAGGSSNGGGPGFIESLDGGNSWTDISTGATGTNGIHTDDHAIAFDASGRLLDGDDGGVFRLENSTPGSIRWSDLNSNLQITQFIGISLDPSNINVAYAGSQDNGTEKFTGSRVWKTIIGGDGGYTRVDFTNPSTVYHEFTGISLQRSDDGGNTFTDVVTGINTGDPVNFYDPYVMDPSNSSRLLLGSNRVYETTNKGNNWTPISTPEANGWTSSSNIDALAIAPSDPNTIYVSTGGLVGAFGSDHHIFVTHNDGVSWQQTDVPGFNDRIADIKVDATNPMIAYAVRDLFTGGSGGHVFKTINGGTQWTDISANLPDTPTNAIAIDPRTHILFVGTDQAVFASNNEGTTWAQLGKKLPNSSVFNMDLSTRENVLAAATHGRGAWEIALAHFKVTASTNTPTPGVPFSLTVTALDSFNNRLSGYTGTVHFTSDDPNAILPSDYTFTAGDHGRHTFTVTENATGGVTITATDTINNGVTGFKRFVAGNFLSVFQGINGPSSPIGIVVSIQANGIGKIATNQSLLEALMSGQSNNNPGVSLVPGADDGWRLGGVKVHKASDLIDRNPSGQEVDELFARLEII